MTVSVPDIPIDNPLIAPSTSPISMAFVVPSACDAVPRAIPLAIGCLIPPILNTSGDIIAPNIPVQIIATTVIASTPPREFVRDIPIGVVIDFGISEFKRDESAFKAPPSIFIDIKDTKTPAVIPIIISIIFSLNS